MAKRIFALVIVLLIVLQCFAGVRYWQTESEKPAYAKNVHYWSTLAGESDGRVSVSAENPVFRQEFVNQHPTLNGFILFFYNCQPIQSGRVHVKLKDGNGTDCYAYQFEPAYMTADTFCLAVTADGGISLPADGLCVLEISVENMNPEDHIEIGTTTSPSKPAIFKETPAGDTLFLKLDYTYQDTEAVVQNLRKGAYICAAADSLMVLVWLWFFAKRKKLAIGLVAVGLVSWGCIMAVNGYVQSHKWYAKNTYIAHAMGAIDGNVYSNSKEAFLLSYEGGHRVFEADFSVTSDDKIVLKHDWENEHGLPEFENGRIPTHAQFKTAKIWGKYTTMDINDLLALMLEYPDIYVVTDSKSGLYKDAEEQFAQIAEILEAYSPKQRKSILKRLVVQIYNDDMYTAVESVLPAENYIYTIYQRGWENLDALGEFCVKNEIPVVTVPNSWWTDEMQQTLKGYGLEVWVHDMDDAIETYKTRGIDGVYTDFADLHALP